MENNILIKKHWTKNDINTFQSYLKKFSKGKDKSDWERRIVNTALPCLAVPSPIVNQIIKQIAKGNFMEFVNLWPWENHTNTVIIGGLICKIKDFDIMKSYLIQYSQKADNWATIDCLKFKFTNDNKQKFIDLAQELTNSSFTYSRRLGLVIMLKLCNDEKYIDKILSISSSLQKENEYYVNMANAWLLSECFIKHRDKTLNILKTCTFNRFTINKTISKCRDSFRVSKEDKEMLLKLKIK